MSELHLELLLGRRVHDLEGNPIGRIEEVRAEQQGDEWVIQEYLIGPAAILERLSAWSLGLAVLHLLGARKLQRSFSVPWNKLDLTDLTHLRLTCTIQELAQFDHQQEQTQQPKATNGN